MATATRDSINDDDDVDEAELEYTLQCLQIATVLGVYGIVCPPLRAWCMPTLHDPGSSCPRLMCVEDEGSDCPGNTWEPHHEGGYTLIWRHYKNADKGGYVGMLPPPPMIPSAILQNFTALHTTLQSYTAKLCRVT